MKKKIIILVLLSILLVLFVFNYSYGFNKNDNIWEIAKEWIQLGKDQAQSINMGKKTDYWSDLAGLLRTIGIWVSLFSGAFLGMRFMIVSPDKKAELKKDLLIWLIGTIVIIGALSIWNMLIELLDFA